MFEIAEIGSPIGPLTVAAREGRLCAVMFSGDWEGVADRLGRRLGESAWRREPDPAGAVKALEAYFDGDLAAPESVPLEMCGTMFQNRVWAAMREIPPGTVVSYGDLATRVGSPRASRAVGSASGANLMVVVVPCHRVVAGDGGLGGYGGGLDRKRWLLDHEQANASPLDQAGGSVTTGLAPTMRPWSSTATTR